MNGLFFEEGNNILPDAIEPQGVCVNGHCMLSCTSVNAELCPDENRCASCVDGFVCGNSCTGACIDVCSSNCTDFCNRKVLI